MTDDVARSTDPPDQREPSVVPPLAGTEAARPPTAPLPAGHRPAREVSAIPPARPLLAGDGEGVAARLVPPDAARPRRTRQELLRLAVLVARVVSIIVPLVANLAFSGLDLLTGTTEIIAVFAALGLTALRVWRPQTSMFDLVADAALVAGLLLISGGTVGPLAFFALVSAFAAGAAGGLAAGLATAAVLAGAGIVPGFIQNPLVLADQTRLTPTEIGRLEELVQVTLLWTFVYPVLGAVGSLTSSLWVENRAGQATLVETNRVLGNLERLIAAAPTSLSPSTVAGAAASEFLTALGGEVALVLFERSGSLVELGRRSTIDAGPPVLLDSGWEELVRGNRPRRVDEGIFPMRLTRQMPRLASWVAVPLRAREHRVGVVLVGGPPYRDSRALRQKLHDLAQETAVAVDNTQVFSKIEHSAAAAERERLAGDLHDGVAQQLTHVRFELELLARASEDPETRSELNRLARVAERATDDVRSAIRGLRAQALDEGLVPALRALVNDLGGSSGPTLELDVRGAVEADPDTETELYRIAQEALSNALRHAQAQSVVVEVDVIQGLLVLAVEDDGAGMGSMGAKDGDGLGLRTMRARAERLGAQFSVRPAEGGGTRMELRMPVEEARNE